MYRSTIVLVLCVLSCALAHGPPPHVKAAMKECVEKLGGDESTMEKLYRHEELEEPQFQCLNACVMKSLHMMNEDGVVDKEAAMENFPKDAPHRERIIEAFNTCADEKGNDDCDTASRIHKCMMSKMPKHHE